MNVAIIQPKYWANVYSILRTADGLGFDKVYVVDPVTQIPKRGTMAYRRGRKPWNKLVFLDSIEEFLFLHKTKEIISIELADNSTSIWEDPWEFNPNVTLVVGNENSGIPKEILDKSSQIIEIPMFGPVRCMNVACAASIVMYSYIKSIFGHYLKASILPCFLS